MIGFALAVVLFIVTITAGLVVVIIDSAREEERQAEFAATLTAVAAAEGAIGGTPPPDSGPPTPGQYLFAMPDDSPRYSPAPDCAQQIAGQVRDPDGQPLDQMAIVVWGDYTPQRILPTGSLAGQDPGQFELTLDGVRNRRVWVQMLSGARYVSPPVEIVFNASDCERSHAAVSFEQIAPFD
jgi:hypothetical protein